MRAFSILSVAIILLGLSCTVAAVPTADGQAAAALLRANASFKVCGYYCGPNFCSNEVISEQQCVATGVWGIASAPGNCADSCCRVHDYCCGEGSNRPACNDAIVACIESNRCYFSVCGALVWAAMKAVSNWCCGSACPTYFQPTEAEPVMTLSAKSYCAVQAQQSAAPVVAFTSEKQQAVVVVVSSTTAPECREILSSPAAYELNQETNIVEVKDERVKLCLAAEVFGKDSGATLSTVMYFPHTDVLYFRGGVGGTKTMQLHRC